MAWQNSKEPGWATNNPITEQMGPGMAVPMPMNPGSLEGGSPYPPGGMPGGMPGVEPGPYPQPGAPVRQYPQPGVPLGPYPQSGVPPTAPLLGGGWPTPNPNCPAGLEYLMALDTLFVQQQVEVLEVITGFETRNKYAVKDARGQLIFHVEEDSDCCTRCCCGSSRPFDMKITNSSMREVITLSRPLRCNSCLCPCCLQEMEVFAGGVKIGTIVQNWSILRPSFSICDLSGDTILMIEGPLCLCSFYDINFKVLSSNGENQVGRISKKWTGFVQEFFTDADVFGISFPMDLDVKVKALLLGACLLIDFMYFESSGDKN